jgi:hypothetical protein
MSRILSTRSYKPYIDGSNEVTAFFGKHRVVLIIDHAAGLPLDRWVSEARYRKAVSRVVAAIEGLWRTFDYVVGRSPPITCDFEGFARIEVAFLRGAAGLAHHGVAGIAIGPAFVQSMVESAAASASSASQGRVTVCLQHVIGYESCRNYIFPEEFTAAFDYHLSEGESCWGWVNQGFVNVLGCLLIPHVRAADPEAEAGSGSAAELGLSFDYFGHDRASFMRDMERHYERYRDNEGNACPRWTDVFMHERLPWSAGTSLDNVYSGLLCFLYRTYGQLEFLRRWFAITPELARNRAPASKADYRTAAENFYLAASFAAGRDLRQLFITQLRWPVREDVVTADMVGALLATFGDAGDASGRGSASATR